MDEQVNKPFRAQKRGKKVLKKLKKNPADKLNTKAFSYNSTNKVRKKLKRAADRAHKSEDVPVIDRTTPECVIPPKIVAVVGPAGVGKSSLIRSLVRGYCQKTISNIVGPITIVGGKKYRVTFIECPVDITAMIDVAKIADLVLLVIDAHFGFEMETFEFLNVAKLHGFMKIIGVLTHMDKLKKKSVFKKTKSALKKRFWKEVYSGAKLFQLTQFRNGKYMKKEIKNLSRFISTAKFKPLIWKNSHSFVYCDRFEDITPKKDILENAKGSRAVSFYGFVRGTNLKPESYVHVLGVGDFKISSIKAVEDPCPLPDLQKRRISELEKKIYAPMSNVGDVICDEDAVYIDIKNHLFPKNKKGEKKVLVKTEKESEGQIIIKSLKNLNNGFTAEHSDDIRFKIFKGGDNVNSKDVEEYENKLKLNSPEEKDFENQNIKNGSNPNDENLDAVSLAKNEDKVSLYKDIYEPDINLNPDKNDEISKETSQNESIIDNLTLFSDKIRYRFVQRAKREKGEDFSENNDFNGDENSENAKNGDKTDKNSRNNEKLDKKDKNSEKDDKTDKNSEKADKNREKADKNRAKIVAKLGITDTMEYNALTEGEKTVYRGFLPGSYVRVVLNAVPCEFVENFDSRFPVVLGECRVKEDQLGFLQANIQKHRWYGRPLKSGDPLIFSAGWRRYQSLPVFSVLDANGRQRMIKYTPQYSHCLATFWGPALPQGTGICCFQRILGESKRIKVNDDGEHTDVSSGLGGQIELSSGNKGSNRFVDNFQIAATGEIKELNDNFKIVKKLKLVGEAFKIEKNTAFIKGMFNLVKEAATFEGAAIRTVSSIRGAIKKALTNSIPGAFRATFEDKILYSDLVFLRCWVPVSIERFYNPLTPQLDRQLDAPKALKTLKTLMRPGSEVRREIGKTQFKADSVYRPVERAERAFAPFKVPEKLQKRLPFSSKQKLMVKHVKKSFQQNRPKIVSKKSKEITNLVTRLGALKNVAMAKRSEEQKAYLAKKQALIEKEEESRNTAETEKRQLRYIFGKKNKNKSR